MFLHMSVILFTGRDVCPIACWDTPPKQTPMSRHPPRQTPPLDRHPQADPSLGRQLPLCRHPLGQTSPGQTPPPNSFDKFDFKAENYMTNISVACNSQLFLTKYSPYIAFRLSCRFSARASRCRNLCHIEVVARGES